MRGRSLLAVVGHAYPDDLFFKEGWGDFARMNEIGAPDRLLARPHPIEVRWESPRKHSDFHTREGTFLSPLSEFLPTESRWARIQLILPSQLTSETPVCLIFSMTGDQGFKYRRENYSVPLARRGIGSLLLEHPFYGTRKPKDQKSYLIRTVEEMLTMSVAAIEEGKSLVPTLAEMGFHRVGVSGLSQGGMVASVVAACTPHPVSAAISLAAHSPEVIFTEGLLHRFVDWQTLLKGLSFEEGSQRFETIFAAGDVTRLAQPECPQNVYLQGARRDLVVPEYSVRRIHAAWPDTHLSWLPGTHISSLALHNSDFRNQIAKSFGILGPNRRLVRCPLRKK